MKKFLTIILISLLFLTGCSKKVKELEQTEVFNNTEDKLSLSVIAGEEIDLNQFYKDKEKYKYTYDVLKADEINENTVFDFKEGDKVVLNEEGSYIITMQGEDEKGNYSIFYKNVNIQALEALIQDSLKDVEKNADLDEILKQYGLKYEGSVDTSKAGVYSIKVSTPSNNNVTYQTVVVAKDELKDGNIVVEEEKKEPTAPIVEDEEKKSETSALDQSDSRVALAYSWEGIGGVCGQVAFNYLQAVGYLQDFSYEDFLIYQIEDKFTTISEPVPFSTLIDYNDGQHVAVYLGNGMALHGNFTGDYANGNGRAKVASMYISGMENMVFKNMDTRRPTVEDKPIKEEEKVENTNDVPVVNEPENEYVEGWGWPIAKADDYALEECKTWSNIAKLAEENEKILSFCVDFAPEGYIDWDH